MLLCQIEMRALEGSPQAPAYYIVGRYGFVPELQLQEDIWINWQVAEQNFEIKAKVISQRKAVYADGKSVVARMNDAEKAKFSAIHPNGITALLDGASLFLVRIFLEAKDRDALFKIQEAIAQGEKILAGQKYLSEAH